MREKCAAAALEGGGLGAGRMLGAVNRRTPPLTKARAEVRDIDSIDASDRRATGRSSSRPLPHASSGAARFIVRGSIQRHATAPETGHLMVWGMSPEDVDRKLQPQTL